MSNLQLKPLKFIPNPDAGFTAQRRPDGGMYIVFEKVTHTTLEEWRRFATAHLEESDRLTTNLYDLRQVSSLSEEAIRYAVEVNSDPSVRNIRLAVVVATDAMRHALKEIDALSGGYGVEMGVFTDIEQAEKWLDRPLTLLA
jgi:hypothetical protein